MTGSAQITAAQNLLQNIQNTFNNQYSTQVSNGGALSSQSSELDNEVLRLKGKLAKLKRVSDTYDREYLDRMENKGGFWRRRGISTLQDWVLLFFFSLYAIIVLGLIAMVIMSSRSPVFGVLIVAGMGLVIGTMIVALIVRFA
jgi:hypothetical protein